MASASLITVPALLARNGKGFNVNLLGSLTSQSTARLTMFGPNVMSTMLLPAAEVPALDAPSPTVATVDRCASPPAEFPEALLKCLTALRASVPTLVRIDVHGLTVNGIVMPKHAALTQLQSTVQLLGKPELSPLQRSALCIDQPAVPQRTRPSALVSAGAHIFASAKKFHAANELKINYTTVGRTCAFSTLSGRYRLSSTARKHASPIHTPKRVFETLIPKEKVFSRDPVDVELNARELLGETPAVAIKFGSFAEAVFTDEAPLAIPVVKPTSESHASGAAPQKGPSRLSVATAHVRRVASPPQAPSKTETKRPSTADAPAKIPKNDPSTLGRCLVLKTSTPLVDYVGRYITSYKATIDNLYTTFRTPKEFFALSSFRSGVLTFKDSAGFTHKYRAPYDYYYRHLLVVSRNGPSVPRDLMFLLRPVRYGFCYLRHAFICALKLGVACPWKLFKLGPHPPVDLFVAALKCAYGERCLSIPVEGYYSKIGVFHCGRNNPNFDILHLHGIIGMDDSRVITDVDRQKIYSEVFTSTRNGRDSLLTRNMEQELIAFSQSMKAVESAKPKINVPYAMSDAHQSSLTRAYPQFSLQFSHSSFSEHPVAAASRLLENKTLVVYSGSDINDVGGDVLYHYTHTKGCRVHVCRPIYDTKDAQRSVVRAHRMSQMTPLSGDPVSIAASPSMISSCSLTLDKCAHKSRAIMMTQVYDASLHDICSAMITKEADMCHMTMITPGELLDGRSVFCVEHLSLEVEIEESKDLVHYKFGTGCYTHRLSNIVNIMKTPIVVLSGNLFSIEMIENRLGVNYYRITRSPYAPSLNCIKMLRFKRACTDVVRVKLPRFCSKTKKCLPGHDIIYLDNDFVSRVLAYVVGNCSVVNSKTFEWVWSYIKSSRSRVVISGKVVHRDIPLHLDLVGPFAAVMLAAGVRSRIASEHLAKNISLYSGDATVCEMLSFVVNDAFSKVKNKFTELTRDALRRAFSDAQLLEFLDLEDCLSLVPEYYETAIHVTIDGFGSVPEHSEDIKLELKAENDSVLSAVSIARSNIEKEKQLAVANAEDKIRQRAPGGLKGGSSKGRTCKKLWETLKQMYLSFRLTALQAAERMKEIFVSCLGGDSVVINSLLVTMDLVSFVSAPVAFVSDCLDSLTENWDIKAFVKGALEKISNTLPAGSGWVVFKSSVTALFSRVPRAGKSLLKKVFKAYEKLADASIFDLNDMLCHEFVVATLSGVVYAIAGTLTGSIVAAAAVPQIVQAAALHLLFRQSFFLLGAPSTANEDFARSAVSFIASRLVVDGFQCVTTCVSMSAIVPTLVRLIVVECYQSEQHTLYSGYACNQLGLFPILDHLIYVTSGIRATIEQKLVEWVTGIFRKSAAGAAETDGTEIVNTLVTGTLNSWGEYLKSKRDAVMTAVTPSGLYPGLNQVSSWSRTNYRRLRKAAAKTFVDSEAEEYYSATSSTGGLKGGSPRNGLAAKLYGWAATTLKYLCVGCDMFFGALSGLAEYWKQEICGSLYPSLLNQLTEHLVSLNCPSLGLFKGVVSVVATVIVVFSFHRLRRSGSAVGTDCDPPAVDVCAKEHLAEVEAIRCFEAEEYRLPSYDELVKAKVNSMVFGGLVDTDSLVTESDSDFELELPTLDRVLTAPRAGLRGGTAVGPLLSTVRLVASTVVAGLSVVYQVVFLGGFLTSHLKVAFCESLLLGKWASSFVFFIVPSPCDVPVLLSLYYPRYSELLQKLVVWARARGGRMGGAIEGVARSVLKACDKLYVNPIFFAFRKVNCRIQRKLSRTSVAVGVPRTAPHCFRAVPTKPAQPRERSHIASLDQALVAHQVLTRSVEAIMKGYQPAPKTAEIDTLVESESANAESDYSSGTERARLVSYVPVPSSSVKISSPVGRGLCAYLKDLNVSNRVPSIWIKDFVSPVKNLTNSMREFFYNQELALFELHSKLLSYYSHLESVAFDRKLVTCDQDADLFVYVKNDGCVYGKNNKKFKVKDFTSYQFMFTKDGLVPNELYDVDFALLHKQTQLVAANMLLLGVPDYRTVKFTNMDVNTRLYEAPPGGGKTYTMVQLFLENVRKGRKCLIVTANRSSKDEIRKKLSKDIPKKELLVAVLTIDSYLMHHSHLTCEVLFVDECFMVHAGSVLTIMNRTLCKAAVLFGDSRQIHYIERNELDVALYSKLDDLIEDSGRVYGSVSFRCPWDVCAWLSTFYPVTVATTNVNSAGKSSMDVKPIESLEDVPLVPGVKYITYTQGEKNDLQRLLGKKFPKDTPLANTVHEIQGETYKRVALVRSKFQDDSPFTSENHVTVALTRHVDSLSYYVLSSKIYDLTSNSISQAKALIERFRQYPSNFASSTIDLSIDAVNGDSSRCKPSSAPYNSINDFLEAVVPGTTSMDFGDFSSELSTTAFETAADNVTVSEGNAGKPPAEHTPQRV